MLETRSKIQKLDQQQEVLSDLIYKFISFAQEADKDLTICLAEISWEKYEDITETIGETSWCRVSYLDGVLELMTTSERHEIIKLIIHDLITDYFRKRKIGCIAVGSATYRQKEQKRGKEADSAYKFSEKARYPEFAIEVNLSSGGIESLEIYKSFETKEVWMWDNDNNLKFYVFEKDHYKETSKSFFLKKIDVSIIKKYVLLIEDNKLRKYQIMEDFIKEVFSKN